MANEQEKKQAGIAAAKWIQDGMTLGLGTGSTVYWTILRLGELVAQGMHVLCIPTSEQTALLARCYHIPLSTLADMTSIDLTIDGADEVDPHGNLIKGGGGALFREKLVALSSKQYIIVVDSGKCVKQLGAFPLPLEVVPFGCEVTKRHLENIGCAVSLRTAGNAPFITDNGNYIFDCTFGRIECPTDLHQQLKSLTGVVETGLFVGIKKTIIVGVANGVDIRTGAENSPRGAREG